jgi:hypothetical protein
VSADNPSVSGLNAIRSFCYKLCNPLRRRLIKADTLLFFCCVCQGCAISEKLHDTTVARYHPSNVYCSEFFQSQTKRVAVLPLTTLVDGASMDFGRDLLQPVLLHELSRARQFEFVAVSSDELRLLSGRDAWSGEETFPADLFEKLRSKLGVDGVLFAQLTQFRAYEPLVVGWKIKLFDAIEPQILWAVDEVFDARVRTVAIAAQRYAQQHPRSGISEVQEVLLSPYQFGHYTASSVVGTIPVRSPLERPVKAFRGRVDWSGDAK